MKRNIPWWVWVLIALFVIGLFGQGNDESISTNTEQPTAQPSVPSPTNCSVDEYTKRVTDTLEKLPSANSIDAITALTVRYDEIAKQLPYECGDRETLDRMDIAMRLALANRKTYLQTNDESYRITSDLHVNEVWSEFDE